MPDQSIDGLAPSARSPLAHREQISAGHPLTLRELPLRTMIAIRADMAAIAEPVRAVTGLDLPAAVRGSTRNNDDRALIWLSPDEWMLIDTPGNEAAHLETLQSAFADVHAQLVDVTDYYTTIEIDGSKAREALSKLTAIDLHPRAFAVGEVVSTTFGKASATLMLASRAAQADAVGNRIDTFHLIVRASLADYLWCMLADAGLEWGMPAQDPVGQVRLHLPHFFNAA